MEPNTISLVLAALLAVGFIAAIIRNRQTRALLRAAEAKAAESETARITAVERAEAATKDLQDERLTSAKSTAAAERVPDLEKQLKEAQEEALKLSGEKAAAETKAARVAQLEADLAAEVKKNTELTAEKASIEASIKKERQAFEEKTASLTALRGEIEKEIKNLAGEALKGNEKSFLSLANEVFQKHRETAAGDLEQRRKAIETMLGPMSKTLEDYRKDLGELDKARAQAYGSLLTELKGVAQAQLDVRAETGKLVNALRAAPKTRGRWGEQQLQNVMELSGMTAYVDYDLEVTLEGDDGKLRPDAIIKMPGGRRIVVDAKTATDAYLHALEAVDDETRETRLVLHAKHVRNHMKQLGGKAYWDALASAGEATPDFVVMFVPGENLFVAAVERDPGLFEDGIASKVLIVTPTTLVALAKAIAFGWRQEKVAQNAQRISELGRELYKRMATMGGHVAAVGKSLDSAVGHYNKFVGSLEGSVMPQARRFNELEVEGAQNALPEIQPLEIDVRPPREGRDLELLEPPQAPALPGA